MRAFFAIALVSFAFFAERSLAFPQNIAHGYTSCTTCHYSPTGGGLMTPYGRSLSREILSQWGEEGEEKALYGAVSIPEWLQISGDFRALQMYSNTSTVEMAKFLVMQADVETGVVTDNLQVVGAFGLQNRMSANSTGSRFISRKHYAQYVVAENQTVRAGKLDLPYGIHWPDHFILSRRDLGWDEGSESYQLAWHGIFDEIEADLSLSAGRPDETALGMDSGINVRGTYAFLSENQVGFNLFYGSNDVRKRLVFGPLASFTLYKNLTLFAEIDFQRFLGGFRNNATGLVELLRLNYELLKGVHVFAMQEYSRAELGGTMPAKEAYTLGFQWFPRPHLELAGGWRKQKTNPMTPGFSDLGWLMMHYYL